MRILGEMTNIIYLNHGYDNTSINICHNSGNIQLK
jgi:hypothetical protein